MSDLAIFGLDLSLNHWGLVCLDYQTGDVINWFFGDQRKKWEKYGEHFRLMHKHDKKRESAENFHMNRIEKIKTIFYNLLILPIKNDIKASFDDFEETQPSNCYLNIEGYAYGAKSGSTYQIGEFAGVVKYLLWSYDWNIRITDPLSVKMWAVSGNAKKRDIVQKARENGFGIDSNLIEMDKGRDDWKGPATDLADAYWLAVILRAELMLRSGDMGLKMLTDKRIEVVNRTTIAYPINLLSRNFLRKEI